jgi:hypothetical protein
MTPASHKKRTGRVSRSTGPRREAPAVCYWCGEPVPESPRFGNAATCDDCARVGRNGKESR